MECLADAPRFNRWMFERVRPWVGDRVLEIGSGIGNLSQFLVDRPNVVLSDTSAEYLERLRERFRHLPNVEVMRLYLPTPEGPIADRRFDTIVCLNVLEHVADDVGSLKAMRRLLDKRGRLVLLVPALRALYGSLDRALGHVRRYTTGELRTKFEQNGFVLRRLEYFNLAGIPGWWVSGKLLGREIIPAGPLRLFDALVPLFRLERFLPWRVGQSLIAIGEAA
ncbi:MAG: class I SAM-dependent methyltransferase [Gemmatimonadales bacterium]